MGHMLERFKSLTSWGFLGLGSVFLIILITYERWQQLPAATVFKYNTTGEKDAGKYCTERFWFKWDAPFDFTAGFKSKKHT